MGKFIVFIQRVLSGSFKRMFRNIRCVHEESGRSSVFIFFDMIYSMIIYGTGYLDYMTFGFAMIGKKERKTFMTMNDNLVLNKKLNQPDYRPLIENKLCFNETFAEYLHRDWLNLAEAVQDGGKLRVYTMEETAGLREQDFEEPDRRDGRSDVNGEENGADRKINLNTASREQLMTLPGIGEAKAEAVIAYREEHGSFQNIEEIKRISGIKDAVFLKIKDRITV